MPFISYARRPRVAVLTILVLGVAACVVRGIKVESLPNSPARYVRSPVKLHLNDGSTVLFRLGLFVERDSVRGEGVRYGLTLADSSVVRAIALGDILAAESFRPSVKVVPTVALSALAVVGNAILVAALAVAIFGSCPTIYADSAGTAVLQAESFSYSIAPLFEARDVDRLSATPGPDGILELEVRNEALETHYINQLEVLEVSHRPDELVVPEHGGWPIALRDLSPASWITDRAGRDVGRELSAADGLVFATDSGTLAQASARDLNDYLIVEFRAPPGADSAALLLRMRNSLLATVLLYDVMLGDRGVRSLDWMGSDLERLGSATELGVWATNMLGMRIETWDGQAYRPAGRVGDVGPIAWKDVTVMVPAGPGPTTRVRLSFLADHWRMDRLAIAGTWRRTAPRIVPLHDLLTNGNATPAELLPALRGADTLYGATTPGERFIARFDVGQGLPGSARTFLLVAQGYYTEWVRGAWLERGRDTTAFAPGRAPLGEALRRWRLSQEQMERDFFATRIPVR